MTDPLQPAPAAHTPGTAQPVEPVGEATVRFYRGAKEWLALERVKDVNSARQKVAESLAEVLGARNISFLLGAGCSSLSRDGEQLGVPTMPDLARECLGSTFAPALPHTVPSASTPPAPEPTPTVPPMAAASSATEAATGLDMEDRQFLREQVGLDVAAAPYCGNLERLLEVLYAQRFVWRGVGPGREPELKRLETLIKKIARFLVAKCLAGKLCSADSPVLAAYRRFYRKLVYRDRSLPRPWVFTTNYDLLSETALDRLGIHHCNGFSGFVERRFDPASFRLALAEQLDVGSRRWSTVDNYIYLCKLHGSVNWSQGDGPIGIREIQTPTLDAAGEMMIYPSPLKHHATLATPYSDLFREFQAQLVREQSVLVTIGYSFSDEHVNAIIYQALSVPTFRLVVFADPDASGIAPLRQLDDPRIWVIGGPAVPAGGNLKQHYFEHVVDNFLPELPGERIDKALERVARLLRDVIGPRPPHPTQEPPHDGGGAT